MTLEEANQKAIYQAAFLAAVIDENTLKTWKLDAIMGLQEFAHDHYELSKSIGAKIYAMKTVSSENVSVRFP